MKTKDTDKILVTGGAGFIGSHLIYTLMNQQAKVCVFDNLTTGVRKSQTKIPHVDYNT